MAIRLSIIILLLLLSLTASSQPFIREGWPLEFDLSSGFIRTNPLNWSLDSNGRIIIAAASGDRIALFDLDGNILPGWPTIDGDGWWITAGPRLGDVTGDGEINVVVMMRSYWADAAKLRVYDLDGIIRQEFDYEYNGFPIATTGAVILFDMDDDNVENTIFTMDSIYALDQAGTLLDGYPRPLEGLLAGELGLVVIPEELEPGRALVSTTNDVVDVEDVITGVSLPGWPIPFPTSNGLNTMPLVIPYEGHWAISMFTADSLFLWDNYGSTVNGFPLELNTAGQCRDLSATDINQDNVPEIAVQGFGTQVWLVNLQGNILPGYPWNEEVNYRCRGEDIISVHIAGEDSSRLFIPVSRRVDDTYTYEHGVMCLYGNSESPGYPIYNDRVENGYIASAATIWTTHSDTLHILHLASYGYLTVFELPLPDSSVRLLWPIPGGNSAGNKVFTYNQYVGVGESDPEHSILPSTPRIIELYPNPANGAIRFELILPAHYSGMLRICDIMGRLVWTEEISGKGIRHVYWNAASRRGIPVPSGRYYAWIDRGSAAARAMTIIQ